MNENVVMYENRHRAVSRILKHKIESSLLADMCMCNNVWDYNHSSLKYIRCTIYKLGQEHI